MSLGSHEVSPRFLLFPYGAISDLVGPAADTGSFSHQHSGVFPGPCCMNTTPRFQSFAQALNRLDPGIPDHSSSLPDAIQSRSTQRMQVEK
jgi:hypothetical protein